MKTIQILSCVMHSSGTLTDVSAPKVRLTYIYSVSHPSSAGSSSDTHICSDCPPCPHTCVHIHHSRQSRNSQLKSKEDRRVLSKKKKVKVIKPIRSGAQVQI